MNKTPIFIGSIKSTSLGEIWAAVSEHGLVCVEYGVTQKEFEKNFLKQSRFEVRHEPKRVASIVEQIKDYVDGNLRDFDIIIDWALLSSDFQRAALKKVFAIPYGETRTYADIAAAIGRPDAPRAVGRANATNPMPLVIPCHRVIGSDGKLHGYGGKGGVKTKAWLLKMEKENR